MIAAVEVQIFAVSWIEIVMNRRVAYQQAYDSFIQSHGIIKKQKESDLLSASFSNMQNDLKNPDFYFGLLRSPYNSKR